MDNNEAYAEQNRTISAYATYYIYIVEYMVYPSGDSLIRVTTSFPGRTHIWQLLLLFWVEEKDGAVNAAVLCYDHFESGSISRL